MSEDQEPSVPMTDKERFDDILRRIDHHAFVLRTIPNDFFKTSALAQSGTLFAVLSLIISNCSKAPDAKTCARQFAQMSPAFPDHIEYIVIILSLGIALSIAGYAICYGTARWNVWQIRRKINKYLFGGKQIGRMRDSKFVHFLVPIFMIATFFQIIMLLIIVGWFAPKLWK